MKTDFENRLHTHWQNRNFEAWNQIRGIYADWLGDRMDPLWHFASLPMGFRSVGYPGKRPYMWRLYVPVDQLPPSVGAWNDRVNRHPLLGVGASCFKFTGFTGDGVNGKREAVQFRLRFTVVFDRLYESVIARIPERPTQSQLKSMGVYCKFDTTKHPLGLAGMVTPNEIPDYADEGLFEGVLT